MILVRVLQYVYESHTTFLQHVYEFLRICTSSARSLASFYDLVRYTMICDYIYTRLVGQRTNLARLSTISHNFYTTSDAFKNQRTNGPVNAHLISWPSKAQNIQNLDNIW